MQEWCYSASGVCAVCMRGWCLSVCLSVCLCHAILNTILHGILHVILQVVCVCVGGGGQVLVRAISQCFLMVTLGSCLHSNNWLKLT